MADTLRDQAKKRDDYTCQKCGRALSKRRLEAHHIHPQWAGGPDKLDNLVTLCVQCHKYAPEKSDERIAIDRTGVFLSTGLPPVLDIFVFGVEWAMLVEDQDTGRVDEWVEKLREACSEIDQSDGSELPVKPSVWYDILLMVLEGERAVNEPERLQTAGLREHIDDLNAETPAENPG